LAKIAVELKRALAHRAVHGTPGRATPRMIAGGDGWTVGRRRVHIRPAGSSLRGAARALCDCDRPGGQLRVPLAARSGLMTPGSLMLGNRGQTYECGTKHGEGDRSVAFWYAPEYFERLAADAGTRVPAWRSRCRVCRRCVSCPRWSHAQAQVAAWIT